MRVRGRKAIGVALIGATGALAVSGSGAIGKSVPVPTPTAKALPATALTSSSAMLDGALRVAGGGPRSWFFQLRRSGTQRWQTEPVHPVGRRNAARTALVTQTVRGLRAATEYEFRLCIWKDAGAAKRPRYRVWCAGTRRFPTRQTQVPPPPVPQPAGPPAIAGTPEAGQVLTVVNTGWTGAPAFGYQWESCDGNGGSCAPVAGATGTSYPLADSDVGHTMRATVVASNASGSTSATSAQTAAIRPRMPASTDAPTISGFSGAPVEGQTLYAGPGAWTGSPTSYTYQWLLCRSGACTPTGQTGPSYSVQHADVGGAVAVTVTATNATGSASATSAPTPAVAAVPPPTVSAVSPSSGPATGGTTVTITGAGFTTGNTVSFGGTAATNVDVVSATEVTATAPAGSQTVDVTVASPGGSSATSAADQYSYYSGPPSLTQPPKLDPPGSATQGQTVTAETGGWTNSPSSYSYKWEDCDAYGSVCSAPIPGATSSSYTLSAGDVGYSVVAIVTAHNAYGSPSATTPPSGTVEATTPPVNQTLPAVSGTAQIGQLLTTDNGQWEGHQSPTYTYQWQDCDSTGANCTDIPGATNYWYVLGAGDATHAVRVSVAAANPVGATTVFSSASPVTAPPAPVNNGQPAITGTDTVGDVLTVSDGAWDASTGIGEDHSRQFSYQWQDCDAAGGSCTPIQGATQNWYLLAAGDENHTVKATVTATNAGGSKSIDAPATQQVQSAAPTTPAAGGLHVSGNKLLDANGNPVQMRGVNRSGTEYSCVQDGGFSDGPVDDASVAAIASWDSNIVRVPINEDCWLGINGADPGGTAYQQDVINYVNLLHQHHMYAELSLMWGLPGAYLATYQSGAPDADHSPALWASLANAFRNDPDVILAPWGETVVDASCFLNGGVCSATYDPSDGTFNPDNAIAVPYDTAGMQQAVDVMRQAGYNGVIAIPGVDFANDLSQWLQYEPTDIRGQLIAEAHVYGDNVCGTPNGSTACLDSEYAPVAAQVPLIFGEAGDTTDGSTWDGSSCGSSNIDAIMNWADAHGVGYETWAWDVWDYSSDPQLQCEMLINDYSGTPANGYGAAVKVHYQSSPASPLP